MTVPTVHNGCIDVNMRGFEGFRFFVMTLAAQCLNWLHQKLVLGRRMRPMAGKAVCLRGRVNRFLVHSFLQALVTDKADVRGLRGK